MLSSPCFLIVIVDIERLNIPFRHIEKCTKAENTNQAALLSNNIDQIKGIRKFQTIFSKPHRNVLISNRNKKSKQLSMKRQGVRQEYNQSAAIIANKSGLQSKLLVFFSKMSRILRILHVLLGKSILWGNSYISSLREQIFWLTTEKSKIVSIVLIPRQLVISIFR